MTLVDGPDTVPSESTEDQTGRGDHGTQANTDTPSEVLGEPPEQESDTQSQGGLPEGHTSPADVGLGLDFIEGQEEVTLTGDDLPDLAEVNETPTRKTVEEDQTEQYKRMALSLDKKLETIMQSVGRIPVQREGIHGSSPEEVWSLNSQRELQFDEPKPKVVFFEPETISRGPTRRDSQAWNEVINDASKQAEVHKHQANKT